MTCPRGQWHLLNAHEVVALLRDGAVTPSELIDVVEERLAATEGVVHATPITCFERARAASAALKHPASPPPGYLYGLPILIKDTQAVAGVRFTQGSPLHADRIAEESDEVVLQLEAMGGIVVGKTNTPEFAAGSHTFNPVFPTTVSPWDTRTSAGGSSGGAAAALASCQVWLASGSDLGGSLRTPAAFCGVVGFRVSPGRVPRGGGPSGPLEGLHSTNGPMGRCVRDVGLFLDAMAGQAGWDFEQPALPAGQTWEAAAVRGAAGEGQPKRVGFSTLGCPVAPAVEELCHSAAKMLAGQGAGSHPVRVVTSDDLDFRAAERAFFVLRAEMFAGDFTEEMADPAVRAQLKPEIVWNASAGMHPETLAMAAEVRRSQLPSLCSQVRKLFETVDVLCAPMTLDGAFDASVRYPTELCGRSFDNYLDWMLPAGIVSAMLCPSISVPCGFLQDGRPVGVQIVGPPGGDAAVLEAAAALEASLRLPTACPEPKRGTAPLQTVGPTTVEEAAQHHEGAVERFAARYR